jgi:hypothetical protein
MRCPACNAENQTAASRCQACQATLKSPKRRPRRRGSDEPLSPQAELYNREVMRLYHWSMLAMVPFLSLVLGPLLAYRAHRFRCQANDPDLVGVVPVDLAFWLGVTSAAASWLGLALVLLGLWLR